MRWIMTSYVQITIGIAFFILDFTKGWLPDTLSGPQQRSHDQIVSRFVGKDNDLLKVIYHHENLIYVGGRDTAYKLSLNGLEEIDRIEWHSSNADQELCTLKGKAESVCHNFIRVFQRMNDEEITICGTNSFKPRCRHLIKKYIKLGHPPLQQQQYNIVKEYEAQGLCPYSPNHNSTYINIGKDIFSATVADFSGGDPLIYGKNLRTEQYDLNHLNRPNFVGALEFQDFVYFFFREISMENPFCDKTTVSRIARVCKNDRGGPYTLSKSWTSFMKVRLNCSVPGDYPFYFDEIQSISKIIENSGSPIVYAVFTTSTNAISGSAVCAFDLNEVTKVFEEHTPPIKLSENRKESEIFQGQCVNDSRLLSVLDINFIRNHPLVERSVPALYREPVLTKVNLFHRLTAIVVYQIHSHTGEIYNVMYTGTDDGKINKFLVEMSPEEPQKCKKCSRIKFLTESQVMPLGVPIRELLVSRELDALAVVSDSEIVSIPIQNCIIFLECNTCIKNQDSLCMWDKTSKQCKQLKNNSFFEKVTGQNLNRSDWNLGMRCGNEDTLHTEIIFHENLYSITNATESGQIQVINEEGNSLFINKIETIPGLVGENRANRFAAFFGGEKFMWVVGLLILTLMFAAGLLIGSYVSRLFFKFHESIGKPYQRPNAIQYLSTVNMQESGQKFNKENNLWASNNQFMPLFNNSKIDLNAFVDDKNQTVIKNSTHKMEMTQFKTETPNQVKRTYI